MSSRHLAGGVGCGAEVSQSSMAVSIKQAFPVGDLIDLPLPAPYPSIVSPRQSTQSAGCPRGTIRDPSVDVVRCREAVGHDRDASDRRLWIHLPTGERQAEGQPRPVIGDSPRPGNRASALGANVLQFPVVTHWTKRIAVPIANPRPAAPTVNRRWRASRWRLPQQGREHAGLSEAQARTDPGAWLSPSRAYWPRGWA